MNRGGSLDVDFLFASQPSSSLRVVAATGAEGVVAGTEATGVGEGPGRSVSDPKGSAESVSNGSLGVEDVPASGVISPRSRFAKSNSGSPDGDPKSGAWSSLGGRPIEMDVPQRGQVTAPDWPVEGSINAL